jgi:hypothetical protein
MSETGEMVRAASRMVAFCVEESAEGAEELEGEGEAEEGGDEG